jgi:hypothetical protein
MNRGYKGTVSSLCLALVVLGAGILLTVSATPAWSQATSTSSVVGQVTDQSGAVVPGAQVALIDADTRATRSTASNDVGRYIFVNVNPGTYTLRVSKAGFAHFETAGLRVTVGGTATVNATLNVGATTQTIVVEATAGAELQTSSATVGSTISSKSMMSLPNLGRDVQTLAVLQPAVSDAGYTAGAYMDMNTYLLDGGNTTDDMGGNTIGYQTNFTGTGGTQTSGYASGVVATPIESVEEIRVSVFGQGADFNNSTGASVQMVTKRGTNAYHGSGYGYYYATNIGAANSWTADHTPSNIAGFGPLPYTPLIPNHRDRFGAAIGGPVVPKDLLGKKWYAFFNYEGFRYPSVGTGTFMVPSDLLRAGVIQVPDSSGKYQPYNLNPTAKTVNGVTYQPAACPNSPNGLCDPRGLGLNPMVDQIWSKFMPHANSPAAAGDGYNTQGYITSMRTPLTSNNYVGRVDHDFNDKWRWMASYRYTRLVSLSNNQVDIGGALPGDTLGQAAPKAPRNQIDGYMVTGVTTNITPAITNDFRFAYVRQFWQWGTAQAPAQLPGLGGALEMMTSSSEPTNYYSTLIPYNINSQSIRQRFWDGQDKQLIDNMTMIKGNHLFQFGASYQRNYDFHMRTDNGVGVNNQVVYWINNGGIFNWSNSPYIPSTVPSSQYSSYENLYAIALGMVSNSQVDYMRAGKNLTLQPIGSVATDQSVIPYYNLYFSDTWHLKPSVTFTYGMAYALEMPPYELTGKQVVLVDQAGTPVTFRDFMAQRQTAALAGQVYMPNVGYETVRNVGAGLKYPYNPFYGQFSPRVSVAWNPHYSDGILGRVFVDRKTVLRLGYGRIWGRINGVNQVLVPLLGPGIMQPVQCQGVSRNAAAPCPGTGVTTAVDAFRIGTDGMVAPLPSAGTTLAQPFFAGGTNAPAGDAQMLDPNFRPSRTDNLTFSLQRQLSNKMTLELGYIGRISKNEYAMANIDAVPYMTTLGGQTFANAYKNLYLSLCGGMAYPCPLASSQLTTAFYNALSVQPFLEQALGGASSSYCRNYASCTAAFAAGQNSNIRASQVTALWLAMNNASSSTLPRSMFSTPFNGGYAQATSIMLVGSYGWSNYNAGYVTWRASDWHGLTATSNFTWGRALGTGELAQYNSSFTYLDPFNLKANYGLQGFDYKFNYNLSMFYQPPFFKRQKGLAGRLLGGWTVAPLFTARSGAGTCAAYEPGNTYQAFGESNSSGSGALQECAVGTGTFTGSQTRATYNNAGNNGVGTNNPYGVNMFSDPAAVYSQLRPCILGIDTSCGGYVNLRGLPRWNLDATISKDISIVGERVGATLSFQFTNIMNHVIFSTPASLSLTAPTTFGRITGQANTPRQLEFGLRIHF